MTPALRTAILDALMERWRENTRRPEFMRMWESSAREYFSSCLDMILPVAEPMIRQAALREAADVAAASAASRLRAYKTPPDINALARDLNRAGEAEYGKPLGEPK